jgi:hypothetical protein
MAWRLLPCPASSGSREQNSPCRRGSGRRGHKDACVRGRGESKGEGRGSRETGWQQGESLMSVWHTRPLKQKKETERSIPVQCMQAYGRSPPEHPRLQVHIDLLLPLAQQVGGDYHQGGLDGNGMGIAGSLFATCRPGSMRPRVCRCMHIGGSVWFGGWDHPSTFARRRVHTHRGGEAHSRLPSDDDGPALLPPSAPPSASVLGVNTSLLRRAVGECTSSPSELTAQPGGGGLLITSISIWSVLPRPISSQRKPPQVPPTGAAAKRQCSGRQRDTFTE